MASIGDMRFNTVYNTVVPVRRTMHPLFLVSHGLHREVTRYYHKTYTFYLNASARELPDFCQDAEERLPLEDRFQRLSIALDVRADYDHRKRFHETVLSRDRWWDKYANAAAADWKEYDHDEQ